MADFQTTLNRTLKHEGGYANIPGDNGGETYRGISRRWHSGWPGWQIIDGFKTLAGKPNPNFLSLLSQNEPLDGTVSGFYRGEYWIPLYCEQIDSQAVVNELFDTAVLMGKKWAVTFLQSGLNALNKNQSSYPDIEVDGKMGPTTLQTTKDCLSNNDESLLVKIQDGLQLARFIKLMDNDPSQEQFARGWIEHRINIGKTA